jgi:beta-barrel assembly-enhancing protease
VRKCAGTLARVLLVGLIAASCATRVPPIGAAGTPFTPSPEERRLWSEAEREEESLLTRVAIYEDPILEEYLGRVAAKLTPAEVGPDGPVIKFVILRDPTLAAFAMPEGRVFLHTGLLSRVENEAQLATVLGHELMHVYARHFVVFTRDTDSTKVLNRLREMVTALGTAPSTIQDRRDQYAGAAVLSRTANAILGLGLKVCAVSAIHGYGRDLEREADVAGMAAVVRAGYDPKESLKLFKVLRDEAAGRGPLEAFFFGNAARLQERHDSVQQLLLKPYKEEAKRTDLVKTTEGFEERLRVLVRENAALDTQAGRFPLAKRQLDRVLKATPNDAIAHLYDGELHRLQSQRAKSAAERETEVRMARESYEQSVALDPAYPDPFRQLGLLYYQQKDPARARAAFERYLALKPDAADAKRVREYLGELER